MVSAIIYIVILALNILSFYKRKNKTRWFNLIIILFMAGMAFVIKWHNLP